HYLHNNEFSGEIPAELGLLSNLQVLDLHNNELSGNIPPEIGDITSLLTLNVGNNNLTGEIPSQIGVISNLIGLDLSYNQLSAEIPPELGNLQNLTHLSIQQNSLEGEIPPELGLLGGLEYLALDNNFLTGFIPTEICSLTNLVYLALSNNNFDCPYPACLDNLPNATFPNLEDYYLDFCPPVDPQTIFLTHSGQFDPADWTSINAALHTLADTLGVNGLIVDLVDVVPGGMYETWAVGGYADYNQAIAISDVIRTHLNELYDQYFDLQYLTIVGDDIVVPHRRVADLAPIYREHVYADQVANTSLYNSLNNDFFLSDDFYAAKGDYEAEAIYYQPSYAVGRLVGDGTTIVSQIEQFIANSGVVDVSIPTTNFGSRYYYNDGLILVFEELMHNDNRFNPLQSFHFGRHGQNQSDADPFGAINNPEWPSQEFFDRLVNAEHSLGMIAGHGTHYSFEILDSSLETPVYLDDARLAGADLSHNIWIALDCHLGLAPPDTPNWATKLLGQGMPIFIGSTGYTYYLEHGVFGGERFLWDLAERLAVENPELSLGQRFMQTKQAFLNSIFIR
ncbi:MAG: hypothetical protein GY869_21210, partial [Planctomycetes bacterium]|nr:hypothetical protein [Planctomycetota bacterium]